MGCTRSFQIFLTISITLCLISNISCETKQKVRIKRQYFKPAIDGSWLANERSDLIKAIRSKAVTTTTLTTTKSPNVLDPNHKAEITVTNLALSLVNLFDRVKSALCNIINHNCASQQPTPNSN
ncbi:unnamed protein product [Brachionus calyciflorus]|uniref:Uncharacterized protein n=1 Tax=Brachionus calyciflorus TaxID=104777 RepID=A0A813V8U7_9BILA|nr:unnamed protein product [Brachionus calyciflorus]